MTQSAQFPLVLHTVTFTKINFEVMLDFDAEKNPDMLVEPVNNVGLQDSPDGRKLLLVQMNTVINPEKTNQHPYFIEITCLAVFQYPDNMPLDEAKRGAMITGHNVCYGAIRENVSWISGRLPYGPVNLGLSVLNLPPRPTQEQADAKPAE